jgi:hypothetical protein
MKDESRVAFPPFYFHPSAFILHPFLRRRSQVVRQRSAKPLFIGSIPIAASILLTTSGQLNQSQKSDCGGAEKFRQRLDGLRMDIAFACGLYCGLFENNNPEMGSKLLRWAC